MAPCVLLRTTARTIMPRHRIIVAGPAGAARSRRAPWQTAEYGRWPAGPAGRQREPVLLLLHGLGATGDVWDGWQPLPARRWPGRWLAPDLPGHGGSRPLPSYTFDALAAAVASIASGGARTVVLGHSLGGVVGLALASGRFSVPVQAVIGLGIKVAWTQEELDRGVQPGHPGAGDGTGRVAAHPRARDGPQPGRPDRPHRAHRIGETHPGDRPDLPAGRGSPRHSPPPGRTHPGQARHHHVRRGSTVRRRADLARRAVRVIRQ